MLNFQEVNILGQICDTTFGRSSTVKAPGTSIKVALQGDLFTVTYTSIVHFAGERSLYEQKKVYDDESIKATDNYMRNVRAEFKKNCGRALKASEKATSDSVEIITHTPYTLRRAAYYRRVTSFNIE